MRQYIKIIIQAVCNLSCRYCFGDRSGRFHVVPGETIKKLEFILSRYDPGKTSFRVEADGEMLLYPELVHYLENKAKNEGCVIEVLSNGTRALEVINENTSLQWIFSLDGHTAEMNRQRNLTEHQVSDILEAILKFNADIQCVFFKQSVDEINEFIAYLKDRDYKGFLHIFPCRLKNQRLNGFLDFGKLLQVDFIPDKEYFRRWKFMYDTGKRDFLCDFFTNGFTYYIAPHGIRTIKCNCFGGKFTPEYDLDNTREYNSLYCGSCFTHFEYNNKRSCIIF